VYEWTNQIPLNADPKSPVVNFVQLTIFNNEDKQTFHCSWVRDLEITKENVVKLVRGARSRWKIENEGFNTLKNQGYHLEHNFGHGKQYLTNRYGLPSVPGWSSGTRSVPPFGSFCLLPGTRFWRG
jgi:hypothetical protein